MTDDVLIRVEGVKKKFCRSLKRSLWYGMQDMAGEVLGNSRHGQLREGEFWAVNDVSFELRRGDCIGLMGLNGAGKTTLLKMINGLIKPDGGRIEIRGRIGALIALGAGFNPILTGRENIYVNGSVLGLSKREIDDKIDEIIDFADIGDFIDSPLQSYSSGMAVRLGFSVASSIHPDVLILDEVLAVGDFRFRMKCYDRIARIREETAVVFVSHQIEHLRRICTHGIHLQGGMVHCMGKFDEAAASYNEEASNRPTDTDSDYAHSEIYNAIIDIAPERIQFGDALTLAFECSSKLDLSNQAIRVVFATLEDNYVAEWCSLNHEDFRLLQSGEKWQGQIHIPQMRLKPGTYKIIFNITAIDNSHYLLVLKKGLQIEVAGSAQMIHHVQL